MKPQDGRGLMTLRAARATDTVANKSQAPRETKLSGTPKMTTTHRSPADVLRAVSNIVFCIAQIAVPRLTEIPGFFGIAGMQDMATRSAQSPSLLTPPGFSFAIWGLIFAALSGYAIYQALPSNLSNARLRRIGWWTAAGMALNAAWSFVTAWTGISWVTVVLIALNVASFLKAYSLLYERRPATAAETAFVIFPVSIVAAWITVASILNAVSWWFNAGGFGGAGLAEGTWVASFAALAGLVGAWVMWRNHGNGFYAAVLLWGLGGIFYKCVNLGEIVAAAGAGIGIAFVLSGYGISTVARRNEQIHFA
jgi:hypothetical protein